MALVLVIQARDGFFQQARVVLRAFGHAGTRPGAGIAVGIFVIVVFALPTFIHGTSAIL